MTGLADPRGKQADDYSWRAEKAMRAGNVAEARGLYARAADIEQAIALDSLESPIRVRSVLAVSAVALWYKAGRWSEVEALVHRLLADPERFTAGARAELRDLLQRSKVESRRESRGPRGRAADRA